MPLQNKKLIFPLLLTLLIIAVTFIGLGVQQFSTRGEPREALVAQSIVRSGDWILPVGYAAGVPSKPPLTHWFMALFSLPGEEVTELTSRLPSAIASLIFALCFYLFVRRRTDGPTAFVSSALLVTTIEWARTALVARVDLLLSACLSGALLSLYAWWEASNAKPLGSKSTAPLICVSILCSCGAVLSKGPIGIALPLFIFTIFLFIKREPVRRIVARCAIVGVPVLLLASIWYILAWYHGGDAFSAKIYYENVARFTSTMEDEPHKHGAFYLIVTTFAGLIPWSLFWLPITIGTFSPWNWDRQSLIGKWRKSSALSQYFFLCAVIIFLFFCIPSSKRSVYVLPAYPFICFFGAEMLLRLSGASLSIFRWAALILSSFLGSLLALCGALVFIRPFGPPFTGWKAYIEMLYGQHGDGLSTVLFAPGIMLLVFFASPRLHQLGNSAKTLFAPLLLFIATAFLAINLCVVGPLNNALSPKDFCQKISPALPNEAKLYSYQNEFYGVSFYLARRIDRLDQTPRSNAYIFVYEHDLPSLHKVIDDHGSLEIIARSEHAVVKMNETLLLVRYIAEPR